MLQVSKPDWLVWMVVFLGCLFVGIDWGLAFGVGLAVLIQLGHITFPRPQVLGRIPETTTFRSVLFCTLCLSQILKLSRQSPDPSIALFLLHWAGTCAAHFRALIVFRKAALLLGITISLVAHSMIHGTRAHPCCKPHAWSST